jgi:hypothetical protein
MRTSGDFSGAVALDMARAAWHSTPQSPTAFRGLIIETTATRSAAQHESFGFRSVESGRSVESVTPRGTVVADSSVDPVSSILRVSLGLKRVPRPTTCLTLRVSSS